MNKHQLKYISYIMLCFIVFVSCKHHEEEYHGVNDKIEAESKNYDGTSLSSEPYFDHVKTMEITEGEYTFLIPERKSQIRSYACTECHTGALKDLQKDSRDTKRAHWDIKLDHANESTMNCITCHDGSNLDNLHSLTDQKIDFNKSYQLCSQCHTKQFEDWKGGAHGKRIGGWAPPRASMTCVNCHNPHKPHFETRWPARFNTQKVLEREQ